MSGAFVISSRKAPMVVYTSSGDWKVGNVSSLTVTASTY
jgi:hypothetical protein